MFEHSCPKCGRLLPDDDINRKTNIAFCRNCNVTLELKELKRSPVMMPDANLSQPPPGTWVRDTGMEKVIGATCRSVPKAIVVGLVGIFWNVPVLAFVAVNIIATVNKMGIRLPDTIPAQLREAGTKMPLGIVCFLWLFLTPFVAIGVAMFDAFLSYLYGRVEVFLADGLGNIMTPFCGFQKRRPFKPAEVKRVWIDRTRHRTKRGTRYSYDILMEMTEGKPIKFGSYLRDDRRNFVAAALNAELAKHVGPSDSKESFRLV